MSCTYTGATGYLLYFTLQIPLLVSVGLSAIGLMAVHRTVDGHFVGEPFFLLFSLWLHYWQWALWPMQEWFSDFSPPLCPGDETYALYGYAFPSVEAFYVGAVVSAFLTYRIMTPYSQTWSRYGYIAFIFLVPSGTLIWFRGIVWWQVLVSLLYGAFVAAVFILIMVRYLSFRLNAWLNTWPISWLGLRDSYVTT